jgi:diguanylate cyclase (GGDEF)-like protein
MGRIGGEEFSIFLPNTAAVAASQVAEQLRRSIEVLMPSFGGRQLEITASIGVARNHQSDPCSRFKKWLIKRCTEPRLPGVTESQPLRTH